MHNVLIHASVDAVSTAVNDGEASKEEATLLFTGAKAKYHKNGWWKICGYHYANEDVDLAVERIMIANNKLKR